MAALGITLKTSLSSGTDAASYTTASITVAAGDLVILTVTGGLTGGGADQSPTSITGTLGSTLTWTKAVSQDNSTPSATTGIWWAIAPAGASGTITANFGATMGNCAMHVHAVSGADPSSPIVQAKGFASGTANPSFNFNSAVNAANMVVAASHFNNTVAPTAGAGYTISGTQTSQTSPTQIHSTEYDLTAATTVAWTHTGSFINACVAVEIRADTGARAASDSAPATDAVAARVTLARAQSDTGAGTDASVRTSAAPRGVADTAAATDSTAGSVTGGGLSRSCSDNAPAVDSQGRQLALPRAAADAAAGTDTLARSSTRSRSTADTAAAADVVARTSTRSRSTADTAAAADTSSRQPALARAAGDTAAAADVVARLATHPRALGDSAPAIDSTVPSGAGGVARSTSDSAPATDSTTRSRTSSRAAADSAPATDATAARRALLRSLGDNAPAADLAARAAAYARSALDSALAGDAVGAVVSLVGDLEPAPPERTYTVAGRSRAYDVAAPSHPRVATHGRLHVVVAQPRRYPA